MALISQMYNIGGGSGGNNASLPPPPKKAARNTADITATVPTGITTGWNGNFSYTYYHWDVRSIVPNCRFAIANNAAWDSASVMALRNDATGATVWTKAYSTLGSYGPQACCFDMTNGFFYVFTTTNTELRLWKIHLSNGVATRVATDTGTNCPSYSYALVYPNAMLCRFISTNTIELIYHKVGVTPNICYRTTVNVTSGAFTTATEFNAVGYTAPGEVWSLGSRTYGTNASTQEIHASVQYITADGKISVSFTPSRLTNTPVASTATDGGDRGSIRTLTITRGLGRCSVSIVDPGYNTPYRHDSKLAIQEQFFATDNLGTLAMMTARTQYIPGWDGRFEFYDAKDFDRWLTEIADGAGLPNGSFW